MSSLRLVWQAHKWTGIVAAMIVLTSALTGFLLLLKKKVDWIQPPTLEGAAGGVEDFITIREVIEIALAQGHDDFRELDDVDRIDFRPDKRVFKVISVDNYSELQLCAVTGEVMSSRRRPSDLLEDLHDGSFWAGWWHDWAMPLFAAALVFMTGSGLWLWLEPKLRRRKRRRGAA